MVALGEALVLVLSAGLRSRTLPPGRHERTALCTLFVALYRADCNLFCCACGT